MGELAVPLAVVGLVTAVVLASAIRNVPDSQRLVLYRLGRLVGVRGPGIVVVVPFIDRAVLVQVRFWVDVPVVTVNVRNSLPATVGAAVHYRLADPAKALTQVAEHQLAISQLAEARVGKHCSDLDVEELIAGRDGLSRTLRSFLDADARAWGIEVEEFVLKRVDLADEAMEELRRRAEAEREGRAQMLAAERKK